MNRRTLTKSRFKLALECPTKVFYSLDDRYANAKDKDEFLEALADGGFQVGELARLMYAAEDPSALEIRAWDASEQLQQTGELLSRAQATIFEGTVAHGDMLVRVDVLRKRGNTVELIEVKSKGFRAGEDSFRAARGGLRKEWLPYLQDVAFQTWVCRRAYPELDVRPFLLLVDPTVPCPIDGLGAAIRVERNADGQPVVRTVPGLNVRDIQPPVLTRHDVSEYVDEILEHDVETPDAKINFVTFAERIAAAIAAGDKVMASVGSHCKKCEFYCEPTARTDDIRSGWAECMEQRYPGRGQASRSATVFALYSHRRVGDLLSNDRLLLTELRDTDVGQEESRDEITLAHRHRLQIAESKNGVKATLMRAHALRKAFDAWRYPLHFIDFETARPTLPFTAGRRPNEQLLFQFSHHVLDADGRVEHRTQHLVADPGRVPNASVVRALRDTLTHDKGTVLHWWDHERSVLNDVRSQLVAGSELDRDVLVEFIQSLVGLEKRSPRMFDMGRLVARTSFIAGTEGRSSIKRVLRALLSQSALLRERYRRPVYGTPEMPSLNFRDWVWWREVGGRVLDPYELLGQLLPDALLNAAARDEAEDESSSFVANGGAAMMAYGELQRPDLPAGVREQLEGQLLRYCELDTLAMVMVYQALRESID